MIPPETASAHGVVRAFATGAFATGAFATQAFRTGWWPQERQTWQAIAMEHTP